ncbi:MAG: T9SS type A sorting domain-containing protein [Bacteroidales bacterium]|nr:T9SS type A sorting domain-containing protein [Bacteroidales bacterium]
MRILYLIAFFSCLFHVQAQQHTVTFTGKAQLWNETDHSSIKITISGIKNTVTAYADEQGNFSVDYTYSCTTIPFIGEECDNRVVVLFSNGVDYETRQFTIVGVTENTKLETVYLPKVNTIKHICIITRDEKTDNNMIVWERSAAADVAYYIISKFNFTTLKYDSIGIRVHDSLSVFTDKNTSKDKADKYILTAVSSNGEKSLPSTPKRTLYLDYTTTQALIGDSVELELKIRGLSEFNQLYKPDSVYLWEGFDSLKMNISQRYEFQNYLRTAETNISEVVANDRIFLKKRIHKRDKKFLRVVFTYNDVCSPAILKSDSGPYSQSLSNIAECQLGTDTELETVSEMADVFPNPISAMTWLQLPIDGIVTVFTTNGKTIFTEKSVDKKLFIPNINTGIYTLKISGERLYSTQLFIK